MKTDKLKSPCFVNLDVTDNCNWNCEFCAVDPYFERKSFTPTKKLKEIIDNLNEAGVFEVSLFGGEPTYHPYLSEIANYCYDYGFEINLVTNGSLIDENLAKDLSKYLNGASVSIHGFEQEHNNLTRKNTYRSSIKGLDNLLKENIPTSVCTTLTKKNNENYKKFGEYLLNNFDIEALVLDRFVPVGRGEEKKDILELDLNEIHKALDSLTELSKEYKKGVTTGDGLPLCEIDKKYHRFIQPCKAGIIFSSVTQDGDVKLCPSSDKKIGNMLQQSLEEIWQNSRILTDYRSFEWMEDDCKSCKIFGGCYGGCKVTRPEETYSVDILKGDYNDKSKR